MLKQVLQQNASKTQAKSKQSQRQRVMETFHHDVAYVSASAQHPNAMMLEIQR